MRNAESFPRPQERTLNPFRDPTSGSQDRNLLALTAQAVLIFAIDHLTWEIERDYLGLVFAPILASATTALGFFFAGNHHQT